MARVGVVTFAGTNCERETLRAFASIPGVEPLQLWHKGKLAEGLDLVVLPGGFSYGDYLRPGSVARFSPLMEQIVEFADAGGHVLGICNGFQILTEAGLLPGALIRNRDLRFISRTVPVRVQRTDTPWTCSCEPDEVLHLPLAHGDGNYVHHEDEFAELEAAGQILLRYCGPEGDLEPTFNPNGSMGSTAGIMNKAGNVFGLMPHPERVAANFNASTDGRRLMESIAHWLDTHRSGEESHE